MANEFKTAYYNRSPENDQKLDEIRKKISDAKDKKAIRQMTAPIKAIKKVGNVFSKVKNNVNKSELDGLTFDDADFLSWAQDEKEIYKNKTLLEKLKSIFNKKKKENPAYNMSFAEFLKKEWTEAQRIKKKEKEDKENAWAEGIFKKAQEKVQAQKEKDTEKEAKERAKEFERFKKNQEKEEKQKAKENEAIRQENLINKILKDRNKQLDKETAEEKQKNKEVFDKVLGKITGNDRIVDTNAERELFSKIRDNENEIDKLKHPENGPVDKFRIKKLEDENKELQRQLNKVRKGTPK